MKADGGRGARSGIDAMVRRDGLARKESVEGSRGLRDRTPGGKRLRVVPFRHGRRAGRRTCTGKPTRSSSWRSCFMFPA